MIQKKHGTHENFLHPDRPHVIIKTRDQELCNTAITQPYIQYNKLQATPQIEHFNQYTSQMIMNRFY